MKESIKCLRPRIVLFDVDSTLVRKEGLNSLAEIKGVKAEVERLTELSMNGEIPFDQAMEEKMILLQPSRKDMAFLAEEYKANLTEDAREVIKALQDARIRVGIITGNFSDAVLPLAEELGIDTHLVHANELRYKEDGSYERFEPNPLMTPNGKAVIVQAERRKYKHITFVGDGATDLATKPFVDRFIGFGGVARRTFIESQSDFYVSSPSLTPVLLLTLPEMRIGLRRLRGDPLIEKARRARSG